MLSRCRGNVSVGGKLNNSFKEANTSIELLQKIGNQNKLIGILLCFKYFKSIINKYSKIASKKKNGDCLIDMNKLNDKLDTLSNKMEYLKNCISVYSPNNNIKNYFSCEGNSATDTNPVSQSWMDI